GRRHGPSTLVPCGIASWNNDEGRDVGWRWSAVDGPGRAFLLDSGGKHDLGTLGGLYSEGDGINTWGMVVGSAEGTTPGVMHAFVYSAGLMQDLNRLVPPGSGWELQEARAINDHGQIAGVGTIGGQRHGYLLTPLALPWIRLSTSRVGFGFQAAGGAGETRTIKVT